MKIQKIHLEQFKRFTDLTVEEIPNTAKLVVLLGPNGCGKSSLFDAFKTWHMRKAYSSNSDNDYCRKNKDDTRAAYNLVSITFYDNIADYQIKNYQEAFYFRTAYRNSPKITVSSLNKVNSPLETNDGRMMIQNDVTVNDNYQRLVSETLKQLYNTENDAKTVKRLRDELLDKIREPMHRLFPNLTLTEIGSVTDKAEFYFSKGVISKYGYEKLSGGEKAAFDLLLDFVVKSEFYKNTIYCIDEPETHIHTSLQAKLLAELFQLVPDESQLWIATHSFGMLKEARRLKELHPNEVVFLNFDGYDFDGEAIITPSECDTTLWNKMIEITLDDYAPFVSPETIVFCEGTSKGRKRKDFDARCYTTIFGKNHPNTIFFSLGGCTSVEEKENIVDFISRISPRSTVIKVIDRDERSPEEIADIQASGTKVLQKRHLECYLLDDEILKKWCQNAGKSEKEADILRIKQACMQDSVSRGNPVDDVKSASNDICTKAKKELGVTSCGSIGEMIMRDTLAKLITPDTAIYQELEREIFS